MFRDEARHGCGFKGLLDRYFGEQGPKWGNFNSLLNCYFSGKKPHNIRAYGTSAAFGRCLFFCVFSSCGVIECEYSHHTRRKKEGIFNGWMNQQVNGCVFITSGV